MSTAPSTTTLPVATAGRPLAPRVVLLTMFEPAGGPPGEFSAFRDAYRLQHWRPLAGGYTDLWANADGLVATVTGIGTAHAASTVMALGLDPALDLRRTTFLLAGIAGIHPAHGSLGSAVWARWVVDADLAHEIDARELPDGWPDGLCPLGSGVPDALPSTSAVFDRDEVHALNAALADWAFGLTRDLDLTGLDTPEMAALRRRYAPFWPAAGAPPRVLRGDQLSGSRYWHGARFTAWAERWVRLWTRGEGIFVTSAMEENGSLRAFRRLAAAGRVDFRRILLLRSGSNFTCPPPDGTPVLESLTGGSDAAGSEHQFPGYHPSRLALLATARPVLDYLLAHGYPLGDE